MSNYIEKTELHTEFEGDKVKVILNPVKRKDFMKVAPRFAEMERDKTNEALAMQIYGEVADELNKYVDSISGLVDASGAEVPKETVLDNMYFMKLHQEILHTLISGGNVKEKDEKKSESPSAS